MRLFYIIQYSFFRINNNLSKKKSSKICIIIFQKKYTTASCSVSNYAATHQSTFEFEIFFLKSADLVIIRIS